ncbi:DedA family protein [Methanooceanicella nereidis]|uniref:DedA family protein n=1 Tax=Methanooceanicella nereidis TaxID=2052831 RepID=UPI001E395FDA|nr:DedA family protein [Methanocella sp. CWC-04]
MFGLEAIVADITNWICNVIGSMGYLGVFILMTIESAGIPVPSEVIMTYGGFMASEGKVNVLLVALVGTLGTGLGSTIGYAIGYWGGKPVVDKYGKFIGITPQKMLWAERWFCKYGESACIYTRLLPVVRTIVNVPAGLLGMNFYKFIVYSMIGAFPWCFILAYIGFLLGENWESIMGMTHIFSYAIGGIAGVILLGAIILYILIRQGIVKRATVEKYLSFILHV